MRVIQVKEEVTEKDGEDAFVNQTISKKDKTNDSALKALKIVNGTKL